MEQNDQAFSSQVLTAYPYPLAVGYRRMLDAPDVRTRVELALSVFEYSLRLITFSLLSQYLIRDAEQVTDRNLNALLLEYLPRATLGTWKRIFFATLRAYKDQRARFFMPELYDLYWDTSRGAPRARPDIQRACDRLITIRNSLMHLPKPTTEEEWQAIQGEVLYYLRTVLTQFAFIQNYPLVRLVQQDNQLYTHIYTGEFIRISTTPLPLTPTYKRAGSICRTPMGSSSCSIPCWSSGKLDQLMMCGAASPAMSHSTIPSARAE